MNRDLKLGAFRLSRTLVRSRAVAAHSLIPCPNCGVRSVSTVKFCGECGAAMSGVKAAPVTAPAPAPVSAPPDPVAAPTSAVSPSLPNSTPQDPDSPQWCGTFRCPVCQSGGIARLPSVTSRGAWSGGGIGVSQHFTSDGHVGTSLSQTATSGVSALARQLAEPDRPQSTPLYALAIVIGGFIGFIGIMSLVASVGRTGYGPEQDRLIGWFAGPIGSALFLWGFVSAIKANRLVQQLTPIYHRQVEIWRRSFYCERCHSVHDPATGRAVPVERAHELING